MTPKEKATELVDKFKDYVNDFYTDFAREEDLIYAIKSNAKECALIAVDEILYVLPQHEYLEDRGEYTENRERIFWQEVKQEIENI